MKAAKASTLPRPMEKAIQGQVIALLRAVGFVVRSTSQYRAAGIATGIPDLMLHHHGLARAGWFEVKRPKAAGFKFQDRATWIPEPLRPDQEKFRADALACGQIYGWGGIPEAEALLLDLGLAEMRAGTFTLRPAKPYRSNQGRVPPGDGTPAPKPRDLTDTDDDPRWAGVGADLPPPRGWPVGIPHLPDHVHHWQRNKASGPRWVCSCGANSASL